MEFNKLRLPFSEEDIEWRIGSSGTHNGKVWARVLCYITARGVMNRLDEVIGPHNWQDEYRFVENSVICTLKIKVDDQWIEKVDGAEKTAIEPIKGGISDALKRAAVKWGIGRYLYKIEENFAQTSTEKVTGWKKAKHKGKSGERDIYYYWSPPELPEWAIPEEEKESLANEQSNKAKRTQSFDSPSNTSTPKPGPAQTGPGLSKSGIVNSKQVWGLFNAGKKTGWSEPQIRSYVQTNYAKKVEELGYKDYQIIRKYIESTAGQGVN